MRIIQTLNAIDRAQAVSICRDIAVLTTARIVEWGWNENTGIGYVVLEDIEPTPAPDDTPAPDEE